jgi:protein O-GlcNAc transferase
MIASVRRTARQRIEQALALQRQGRLHDAEQIYCTVLAGEPRQFHALHHLGVLKLQQQRPGEALELLSAAAKIEPSAKELLPGIGAALAGLGRHQEALAVYESILKRDPADLEARYHRAIILSGLGRLEEALESYTLVVARLPRHAACWFNRGNVLALLGRYAEAIASYDRVLALVPRQLEAICNRADALKAMGKFEESIGAYDEVLRVKPNHVPALNNRGGALFALGRYDEAAQNFSAALAIDQRDPELLFNLGRALQELGRDEEALAAFDRSLAQSPRADAWYSRANLKVKLGDVPQAMADYRRAIEADPDHPHAFDALLRAAMDACDWPAVSSLVQELERRLEIGALNIHPFKLLSLQTTPAIQLKCAQNYVRAQVGDRAVPAKYEPAGGDKLRIAYVSGDFRAHAVAMLVAELFELHDRSRFEVIAISLGPDDGSAMRSRIMQSVDQFHDVRAMSDQEVADLIGRSADIAVDLMGHTQHSRIGIFACRPSPIQINYLGYPGTTGAGFMDYVLADPIVLPFADQPSYSERIVHLPHCYQVNDRRRAVGLCTPSREEAGLPPHGFVFCCFNHCSKITAEIFSVWMRLLGQIPEAVLWLLEGNQTATDRLRQEARARAVDPSRLIFAPIAAPEKHLARHALADLFLDTLPYNAHTTASDALWSGLPLVTCMGNTFAGRVAASLLSAAGMPELVTRDLQAYEALALELARDPALLQSSRRKVAANRQTCALFDSDRSRRHIEAAYEIMWKIHRRGKPPASFRLSED